MMIRITEHLDILFSYQVNVAVFSHVLAFLIAFFSVSVLT